MTVAARRAAACRRPCRRPARLRAGARDASESVSSSSTLPHVGGHRARTRGVARVSGRRCVEARLVAVEPRHRIAEGAGERGEARRSADRLQNQVRRGVVAPVDRRRAEIAERHAALGDMRLGDRRVFEEVARPVGDLSVEVLGAVVDALERGGRGEKLERAAHREPLVGAMLERRAGPVSRTKTPSRPPSRASISASRFVAGLRRSSAEGAARAGRDAAAAARPARNERRLQDAWSRLDLLRRDPPHN